MHHKRHTNSLLTLTAALITLIIILSVSTACTTVPANTPNPPSSTSILAARTVAAAAETVPPATDAGTSLTPIETIAPTPDETVSPLPAETVAPAAESPPSAAAATISFNINDAPTAIDGRILGTNLPAWLGTSRTENSTFIGRTLAAAPTIIRIPGGSWSNWYDWSNCEQNNVCPWDWGVLKPTDFINFIKATGSEAMYIINQNGTSKEAAALVAFFNGSTSDNTTIGVDVRGRDWGKVRDWAQLRSDNGNPNPLNVKYWEIGNEIYGGAAGNGTDCLDWGWEDVWTCDGTEYVNGIGSGANRKEGYLEFRDAMRAVDPTILVGAVGIPYGNDPNFWVNYNNWGNEVIAAAGSVMDFYSIHQYAFFDPPATYQEALADPQTTWSAIMADLETSFDQHAAGRRVPIAVTEYNLFSVQDKDTGQLMTRAVNMLFMADTIGQMMEHGFAMANQWDLANGAAGNGTDYGLLNADSYARSPQYYVFPLWERFGAEMLPVTSSYDAATTLSVYAGKVDAGTVSVLAINKTGSGIAATIQIDGAASLASGTADVVQAASLDSQTVTFNGISNPSDDLSNAPPTTLTNLSNPLSYTFAPYSITLLRIAVGGASNQVSIDDVTVTEGDSGTTNAVFSVSLTPASAQTVTVDYATVDDTAVAGTDYTAVNETLTFNPSVTARTITVMVKGDTIFEGSETFNVLLSNPSNASIIDTHGIGHIQDDDATAWIFLPAVASN